MRGLPNINAKLCQQIFLGLFIPDTVRFLNQPRQLFKQRIGFAFFGKIGNGEVDFIATTADEKKYIQVTESMMSEDVRKRELAPLQSIRDNYEKIVLSLEPGLDTSYDGIKSENLIDWLLNE